MAYMGFIQLIFYNLAKCSHLCVDFYQEHESSHTCPSDQETHMTLLSEKNWISLFNNYGFSQIDKFRANVQDDFPGTLVITGVLDSI